MNLKLNSRMGLALSDDLVVRKLAPYALAFFVTFVSLAFLGHANAGADELFPGHSPQSVTCLRSSEPAGPAELGINQMCVVEGLGGPVVAQGSTVYLQSGSGHVERFTVMRVQQLLIHLDGNRRAQTWSLQSQDTQRVLDARVVLAADGQILSATGQFDGRRFHLVR